MKKIAVLTDTWLPYKGGGQINAYEISKRIASSQIQIDVITRDVGNDFLKLPKNLKIIKLGHRAQQPLSIFSQISFLILSLFFLYKNKYDLIHAHAYLPGITARLIAITKGTPTVFTVHGTSINTHLNNRFKERFEKFILTEIIYSEQITVSRDFIKVKNVNKKISYIPNAVDIKEFKIKVKKNRDPQVIFVGRLHKQKNIKTLVGAISFVVKNLPKIKLLIVGDGPQKLELKELVRDLKLTNHIIFTGELKRKELIKKYKESWLFVLPSLYEGQSLSLLEALTAKLPVITTKTGDSPYLVKNGINGFLLGKPKDPEELATLVEKALNRENGYNFEKLHNFSWDKSAKETLKVYEKYLKT